MDLYDEALLYHDSAEAMSRNYQYSRGIALALIAKGTILTKQKKFAMAISKIEEAIGILKKGSDLTPLAWAYERMAEVQKGLGDYKSALTYHRLFKSIEDSLRSSENVQVVDELMIKYQAAEKERQIAEQALEIQTKEAEIDQRRTQVLALSGGILLVLLGVGLFYNSYRAKQKQKLQAAVIAEKERGLDAVVQATEEERKRISKDLHDGIGQQLSALRMGLQKLSAQQEDTALGKELTEFSEAFSRSADEVRQISHQIMPRVLLEKGLKAALAEMLESSFKLAKIDYEFEHFKVEECFNERMEIALYRIAQELVNNIIKHSGASQVQVQLIKSKDHLMLLVEDNGKGISNERQEEGHGLLNIKNRLDLIKVRFNFQASPNSGTLATVKVPI
jgi:signal transduction histidine kinase